MEILFGTGNPAKLNHMRETLDGLPISLIGLYDIAKPTPSIVENGNSPLENAKIKAKIYYETFKMPVFSCDTGLFIDDLDENRQPGIHVRNIGKKRLSDDEMVRYYSSLAEEMGGFMYARYINAICFIMDDREYSYQGEDISSEKFIISNRPHPKKEDGFPLDALSIHIPTGKYYYDIDYMKNYFNVEGGFREFFKRILDEREVYYGRSY